MIVKKLEAGTKILISKKLKYIIQFQGKLKEEKETKSLIITNY